VTQRKPLVIGTNNIPTVLAASDELPDVALPTNLTMKGLAGTTPPSGATSDREASPVAGRYRYNTTLGCHEGYTPDGWVPMNNVLLAGYRGNVGQLTGTTLIPYGSSAPTTSQGTQVWSQTVTPTVAGSTFEIDFSTMVDVGNNNRGVTIAIFRGTTLLGFTVAWCATSNRPVPVSIKVNDTLASGAAVTYSCRIGVDSSATWYLGRGASATMGGVNNSGWNIREVL
jgi:hypothetical protein